MKVGGQPGPARGSFGIPEEMMENVRRTQETKAREGKPVAEVVESEETPSEAEESGEAPQPNLEDNKEMVKQLNPMRALQKLGIEFKEGELHDLLFNGYYEKEVEIVKGHFNATIKTLTGEEYDMVDELLGEDLENLKMTRDGLSVRNTMWILAFGITKLHGKAICKPVMVDKVFSAKETAKEKRKVLSKLSSALLNKMGQVHGTVTTAIRLISEDPDLLKNS
jgi:hypothetical protein